MFLNLMELIGISLGILGFVLFLAVFVPDPKDKRFKSGIKNNAKPTPFKLRMKRLMLSIFLILIAAALLSE